MVRLEDDGLSCRDHLKKRQDANFARTRCSVCDSCAFCKPSQRDCWKTHLPVQPRLLPLLPPSLPCLPPPSSQGLVPVYLVRGPLYFPSLRPFLFCCATQKKEWKKACYDNPFHNATKQGQPTKKARTSSRALNESVVYNVNDASHDAGLFVSTATSSLDGHLTKHEKSLLLVSAPNSRRYNGAMFPCVLLFFCFHISPAAKRSPRPFFWRRTSLFSTGLFPVHSHTCHTNVSNTTQQNRPPPLPSPNTGALSMPGGRHNSAL
jgi:hypothetical protein